MALRSLLMMLALGLVVLGGCKSSSNYRAPCAQPAVVATTPVAAPCPGPAPCPAPVAVVPPPPGAAVVVPR